MNSGAAALPMVVLTLVTASAAQDAYFPDGRSAVVVPLRVLENGSLPTAVSFTDIAVGEERLPMLLDTGAGFHIVSDQAVERLGLKSGNEMFAIGMADAQKIRRYHLPTFSIGGIQIENAMAMRLSMRTVFRAYEKVHDVEAAGILGAGLFSLGPVTLDFERGEMTVRDIDADYDPPVGATVLDLSMNLGMPVIKASIGGGRAARFVVDTGNDSALIVHGPYAKRRGFDLDGGHVAAGVHGAFGAAKGVQAFIESFVIGGLECSDVPALIVGPSKGDDVGLTRGALLAGNIGLGFLTRFARVTFDYRGKRLVVEPRVGGVRFPSSFGLALRMRRGAVAVASTLGGSPAENAGLLRYDVLKSVDGAACPATVNETVRLLRTKSDVTVRIGRTGQDDFDVRLSRRPLLERIEIRK